MYPRRVILPNNNVLVHVISRCHNKSHLLEPQAIKNQLLLTWARYKDKYGIRIYGFNIMDNHFHAIMRAPNAEMLGHFMRTTNSQMARFINFHFERDSQVFRERYKAPLITNFKYFCDCMSYIFGNRLRVNQLLRPEQDRNCSAFWNLNPRIPVLNPQNKHEQNHNSLCSLLDDISELGEFQASETKNFIKRLAQKAVEKIAQLFTRTFEHSHSICDEIAMNFRHELMRAYRRERGPPVSYGGGACWINNYSSLPNF